MLKAYRTAYDVYMQQRKYPNALRVAQKINDMTLVNEVMGTCKDKVTLN
jgi:hypothetical protein